MTKRNEFCTGHLFSTHNIRSAAARATIKEINQEIILFSHKCDKIKRNLTASQITHYTYDEMHGFPWKSPLDRNQVQRSIYWACE